MVWVTDAEYQELIEPGFQCAHGLIPERFFPHDDMEHSTRLRIVPATTLRDSIET